MIKFYYFISFLIPLTLPLSLLGYSKSQCNIYSYPKIIIISENHPPPLSQIIKKSNCPKKVKKVFLKIFNQMESSIFEKYVNSTFRSELKGFKISLSPKRIRKIYLNEYIKEKIPNNSKRSLSKLSLVGNKRVVPLRQNESFTIVCKFCNKLGLRNFKISIQNFLTGKEETYWGNLNISFKVMALISKKDIFSNFKPLNSDDFEIKEVLTLNPSHYFKNKKELKFYRLNGNISQGSPIKKSNLSPLVIVNYNTPTKILYNNKNLKLVGVGHPLSAGKLGEFIKIQNYNRTKILLGKVIGPNKVQIGK